MRHATIARFSVAAFLLTGGSLTVGAQPIVSVTEKELCDFVVETESGDKAQADVAGRRLRAEAEGAASGVTARAAYGVKFTPQVSFPAVLRIDAPYKGRLQDSAAPKSHYRIEMVLIKDGTGDEVASTTIGFDDKPPPFGPATIVNNLFGGGTANFNLEGGTTFRVVIRLEAHSNGPLSNSDFFSGDRGVSTSCVKITPNLLDTDGDAIFDDWENSGIDVDGGGIDLNLTTLGNDFRGVPIVLNPKRKDILVEIDYFDCTVAGGDCPAGDNHKHKPITDALTQVVDTFAKAPVDNPDGSKGINLWIVRDQALPHQMFCDLDAACFDVVKAANFGPAGSQGNIAAFTARTLVFHYNLWAHQKASGNGSSGESDGGCDGGPTPKWGDDFIVTLGSSNFSGQVGLSDDQRGTFMHELGHNLGLCHGGRDDVNCKPNYQSVMSYTFQFLDLLPGSSSDYSREQLPDLDETNLDETVGIQDGSLLTWFGPKQDFTGDGTPDLLVGPGSGSVNWDWSLDPGGAPTYQTSVSADINNTGMTNCGASPGDKKLAGANDWDNLVFDFRNSEFYPTGHAPGADQEPDGEDVDVLRDATYWQRRHPRFDYAAKLICGVQRSEDVLRLTRGAYGTIVNILNSGSRTAEFEKRLALAFPPAEQKPGNTYAIAIDRLSPGAAIKVDCDDIRARLFSSGFPEGYIDGFVTLESDEPLEVVGVYTLASVNEAGRIIGGSSIEIERVVGTRRALSDLEVKKSAKILGSHQFTPNDHTAEVQYTVTVSNIGQAAAAGVALKDKVSMSAGILANVQPIAAPDGLILKVDAQDASGATLSAELGALEPGASRSLEFLVIVLNRDPPNDMKLDDLAMAKSTSDDLNDTNNKATLETVIPFGN